MILVAEVKTEPPGKTTPDILAPSSFSPTHRHELLHSNPQITVVRISFIKHIKEIIKFNFCL